MILDKYIIAIVTFLIFILGGLMIWGDMIYNYDIKNASLVNSSVFNKTDSVYNIARGARDDTIEGDLEGGDESWESMAKGSYSAVRLVKDSFVLMGDILDYISSENVLNVPRIFVDVAMTVILVSVIFALIYLVFRFKGG